MPLQTGQEIQTPGLRQAFFLETFRPSLRIPSQTGSVIVRVQDESGATPANYLEATIAEGQTIGSRANGHIDFEADAIIYIRIVQTDGIADGLSLPLEVVGTEYLGLDNLTSVALVNQYRGKEADADEALLTDLIAQVSQSIRSYLGRNVNQELLIGEKHDGSGTDALVLKLRPLVSVSAVRIDGTALDPSEYILGEEAGILFRGGSTWTQGRRNVEVDYTGGYQELPADLVLAATKQVVYEHLLTGKHGRLGERSTTLTDGGTHSYVIAAWYPGVQEILDRYREVLP